MSRLVTIAVLFSTLLPFAAAQSVASLNGSVIDPSGAAIAGAIIDVTNLSTSLKRSVVSDSSGLYSFPQMTPGAYRLTAQAPGFATSTVDDVQLLVNTPTTIPIKLKLGGVTETVSVTADSTQVNTVDASLGNAVGTQAIVELPFEARNPSRLLSLQPGVTYFGQGSNYGRGTSAADRLGGSVNGSKPDQNNITLDGVDVNDQNTRAAFQSVLRVTLDSVQEFRATTQNPTAEQGRGSGAQIALITKSGTNLLHGSLYEYNRNTLTSANDFFNNLSGLPRPALIRNLFGASAGGPVKKDRLFFFANYEGRRDASAATVTQLVPTATLRAGTIRYLNASGATSTMTPEQLKAVDPAGLGVNPAVLTAMNLYPLPNDQTLGDGYNTAGYRFSAPTPLRWNTYIAKLDGTLDNAGKHTVFLRGNLQNDNIQGTPQFPGQQPSSVTLDNSKGIAAGLTSIVKPNLISSFRYGLTRSGHETTGILAAPYVSFTGMATLNATTTGVARIIPVNQFTEDLSWNHGRHETRFGGIVRLINNKSINYAGVFPSGATSQGGLAGTGSQLKPADLAASFSTSFRTVAVDLLGPVASVSVTYNFLKNGQALAFGDPVRREYVDREYEGYITDSWHVTSRLSVNAGIRYSLAPAIREANGNQVSPTIDLVNWFETRGNLANNGLSQTGAPPISFVLVDAPGGRSLYDTSKTNFSPRLAIAYSPEGSSGLGKFLFGGPGKTSIRAGFGIFYDLFGMSLMRNFDASAPGLSTQIKTPSIQDLATTPRYVNYATLPGSLLPPPPAGGFPYTPPSDTTFGFASSNSIDQNIKQPYTMNMNFTIGREFSHGLFIQGSYVGRLSRRSLVTEDLSTPTNLRDPKSGQTYWEAITVLQKQARANVPVGQVAPVPFFENFYGNLAKNGQTATQTVYTAEAKVYPTDPLSVLLYLDSICNPCSPIGKNAMLNTQYSSLWAYRSIGKGSYHAMQWTARKRFSDGLLFDFNYTWSKSLDLTSGGESDFRGTSAIILNAYDANQNKGVSDFDVTHALTGSGVFQFPIGHGKRLLGQSGKALDALVGGWQLSGLSTITSGLPRSVLNTGSWTTDWNSSGYATQIGVVPDPSTTKNAVNVNGKIGPNIFAQPVLARAGYDYSYSGNIGQRNGIRGDGLFNFDASLSKTFVMPYKETHSLQLRWEVFNVLNTARFDVTTASLDVANTGTFGRYSSMLTPARVMQFGLRYAF